MAVTRRSFMKTGALVGLAAGLPMKSAAEALALPGSTPTSFSGGEFSHLDMAAFSRQLNTYFRVRDTVGGATLKLVGITDWNKPEQKSTRGECFSLMFVGSDARPLPQATYSVQQSSLGTFSLLLVPTGKTRNQRHYEAVFNRLR